MITIECDGKEHQFGYDQLRSYGEFKDGMLIRVSRLSVITILTRWLKGDKFADLKLISNYEAAIMELAVPYRMSDLHRELSYHILRLGGVYENNLKDSIGTIRQYYQYLHADCRVAAGKKITSLCGGIIIGL